MSLLKKKPPFDRVLCKRTLTSGEPFWWDDEGSVAPPDHPKRHHREHRMMIEGQWYDITEWDKDLKGFKIIDSQGNPHWHAVYSDKDKLEFPDHCDLYGPRDYAKWFYTPEELEQVNAGTYNPSYKVKNAICVLPGKYHWVKQKQEVLDAMPFDSDKKEEWIIAKCYARHKEFGKHYWEVMGHSGKLKTDDDFAEIGEQVESRYQQKQNKLKIDRLDELNDTIVPFLDSLRVKGTEDEKWHAPVEYHFPFILEASEKYSSRLFEGMEESPFFGG